MANWGRRLVRQLRDENFLKRLGQFEGIVSKVLSLAMVVVILVIIIDLIIVLVRSLLTDDPLRLFGGRP